MTEPITLSLGAILFLWVYSCLLVGFMRSRLIKSDVPWWKMSLEYVVLPLTAGIALCVKLLRTFF